MDENWKDVAIREQALALKAESLARRAGQALEEAYYPDGSHYVGDGCACCSCKYKRSRIALAAIKEARHG